MKIQWKEIVILIMTIMLVKITVADPMMEKNRKEQMSKGPQVIEQDRQLASIPEKQKTPPKPTP